MKIPSVMKSKTVLIIVLALLVVVVARQGSEWYERKWGSKKTLSEDNKTNIKKWCQSMNMDDLWERYPFLRNYDYNTVNRECRQANAAGREAGKAEVNCNGAKQCPDRDLFRSGFKCQHTKDDKKCCKSFDGKANKECKVQGVSTRYSGGDSANKSCPAGYPFWGGNNDGYCCAKNWDGNTPPSDCVDWVTGRRMIANTDYRNKWCPKSHPLPKGSECCKKGYSVCLGWDDAQKARKDLTGEEKTKQFLDAVNRPQTQAEKDLQKAGVKAWLDEQNSMAKAKSDWKALVEQSKASVAQRKADNITWVCKEGYEKGTQCCKIIDKTSVDPESGEVYGEKREECFAKVGYKTDWVCPDGYPSDWGDKCCALMPNTRGGTSGGDVNHNNCRPRVEKKIWL